MRYRLRTLMLAVTAGCVFVGCVAYLLGVQEYRSGDSFAYDSGMTDAYAVAKLVRERSRLPGHELTSEKFMQISDLGSPRIVDQFFYRVKRSDGSETRGVRDSRLGRLSQGCVGYCDGALQGARRTRIQLRQDDAGDRDGRVGSPAPQVEVSDLQQSPAAIFPWPPAPPSKPASNLATGSSADCNSFFHLLGDYEGLAGREVGQNERHDGFAVWRAE